MKYNLSERGLSNIKSFEGCRLTAYQDSAGVWTIGYGSTGKVEGKNIEQNMVINHSTAEHLLKLALIAFENDVNYLVTLPLTQNQYDALVSLIYNIGTTNFRRSTLLRKLNAGDIQGAAEQFLVWCKFTDPKTKRKITSAGLLNRRQAEQTLFSL